MPVDDVIFRRLREATAAERDAMAAVLGVKLTGAPDVDVTELSRELRSAGGHSLANLFRDAHELPYRELLVDAVHAAGKAATFPEQDATQEADDAWLEEYILRAMDFAIRATQEELSSDDKASALRAANDALQGKVQEAAPLTATAALRIGVWAGGVAAGVAGVTVLPFALAFMGLKWASPAVKKTLPAVQVLIHIRKRLEAEAALQNEVQPNA